MSESDFERSTEPAATAVPPGASLDDQQVVYYEGSPRLRGELAILFGWSFIGLVFIAVPLLWNSYVSSEGVHWAVIALGIVLGLICWIMPSLLVRRNYFRITNYRIDYEHGLLFKKMDTLELWHVEDVSLRQSPVDRIFNVGTITVISGDATNPRLELRSLSSPRKLLETLKARIIAVKRQRGVVKLDMG